MVQTSPRRNRQGGGREMKQRYVIERRRRPLSRGKSYCVYTLEAWSNNGKPVLVTFDYQLVLALKRGEPLPPDRSYVPAQRAAIVRPSARYL
jgi:hypothetical protein